MQKNFYVFCNVLKYTCHMAYWWFDRCASHSMGPTTSRYWRTACFTSSQLWCLCNATVAFSIQNECRLWGEPPKVSATSPRTRMHIRPLMDKVCILFFQNRLRIVLNVLWCFLVFVKLVIGIFYSVPIYIYGYFNFHVCLSIRLSVSVGN